MTTFAISNTTTPGDCAFTIPVTIVDDVLIEGTENFTVAINSTDLFVTIGFATTTVLIEDNDCESLSEKSDVNSIILVDRKSLLQLLSCMQM